MKKLFKWLFKKPKEIIEVPLIIEVELEGDKYKQMVSACKYMIANYSNRRRYDICQYNPAMTLEDWERLYVYDDEQVEKYKQELLLLEAQHQLGLL